MDSDSDRPPTKHCPNRIRHMTKLPSIYTNIKYWHLESARSISASASSSETWTREKLFPQIENCNNRFNSSALGMCTNNNAKTTSSVQKQSSDESSREIPTAPKDKKGTLSTAARSSEQSASTESKSQPANAVNTRRKMNTINISRKQKQSTSSKLKPTTETNNSIAMNVITDSSEESQGTETPSRLSRVSITDLKSDLNPTSDLLQSTDLPTSRREFIADTRSYLDSSAEQNQITDSPRSRRVSIVEKASYFDPLTNYSAEFQKTESPKSRSGSIMKRTSYVNPTTGSSEQYQMKQTLPSPNHVSQEDKQSNMSLHHTHLMQDSLKLLKQLNLKKRGTMTLLSPTPSEIEDGIRRHGPYEGEIPVIRTEKNEDEEPDLANLPLSGVMSVIEHLSHEEIGFEPDQLVRSDPTVAKAVCDLLKEYTNEDQESLKIIALALCDNQLSNMDVLDVIEQNVKGRTEDNKIAYFAMAFFIFKTQDPTRIQSSNSALTDDDSRIVSRSLMRSEKSVNFLLSELEKFIHLSQRAASIMSKESTSDASLMQHSQSFQVIANATKMSFVNLSSRQSDASSFECSPRRNTGPSDPRGFDFLTPSGWFFDEVEVDRDLVKTIRQSMPALMAFVAKEKLVFFKNTDSRSQEETTQTSSVASKKSPVRQMVRELGQGSPSKDLKQSLRVPLKFHERDTKAQKTPKAQVALKTQQTKANRQISKKKLKRQQRKQKFLGWDLNTDLAPHWLKRQPQETDLIVPLLQNIQRQQVKDADVLSEQYSRKSTDQGEKPPPTNIQRQQVKDADVLSEQYSRKSTDQGENPPPTNIQRQQVKDADVLSEQYSRKSTSQGEKPPPTIIVSADSRKNTARVVQALKQHASADKPMAHEFQEELEESESRQEASVTLPRIRSVTPRPPPYSTAANPRESAQTYMCKHKIMELFAELISNLVLTTPPNPLDTLIDRVHQLNHLQRINKRHNPYETPSMTQY